MTTSARLHSPSPADMARRPTPTPAPKPAPTPVQPEAPQGPRALTPAEAIAPGELRDGERFKPLYQRALLISGLLPTARLMGHTLLWYANHRTGRISPNYQPTVEQLAKATGLNPARVGVQIEILAQRGWVHLHRLKDGPRAGRTRLDLTIPALNLEQVRADRTPRAELGAHMAGGAE